MHYFVVILLKVTLIGVRETKDKVHLWQKDDKKPVFLKKILLEFNKKCASKMPRSHWSKVEADHEVKNSHFVDDFTFH